MCMAGAGLSMARHDPVPDKHELVRYIKRRFLSKEDDGSVELDANGKPAFAFELIPDMRGIAFEAGGIFTDRALTDFCASVLGEN